MKYFRLQIGAAALFALTFALSGQAKEPAEKDDAAKSEAAASEETEAVVQTPFGPARRKVNPESAKQTAERSENKGPRTVDVAIEGDTVKFRRKTPFGVQAWSRKMSELSPAEKRLVEEAKQADAKPESKN